MTSATDSPQGPVDLPAEPPEATGATAPAAVTEAVEHRQRPRSEAFKRFIASGCGPRLDGVPGPLPSAPFAKARREALSEACSRASASSSRRAG